MNNIPNAVSISRMVIAFTLLFLPMPGVVFYIAYVIAGLSDLLDGFLARKLCCVSVKGSWLDKIADLVLYTMLLIKLLMLIEWQLWIVLVACSAALLKALGVVLGVVKYKRLFYTHTYLNKAAGFCVFLWPITAVFGTLFAAVLIAVVTIISAIEECIIIIATKEYNNRRKSLFPLDRL